MTVTTPETDRFGNAGLAQPTRQALPVLPLATLPVLPLATLAVLALAILQQVLGHHNTDNSWLFTVGEKLLGGATPYVDVIEANPPASIMLYMPAVLLGRLLPISSEFAANLLAFLGVAGALHLTSRILRKAGLIAAAEVPFLWLAGTFTLMLLPGACFAEREHIAAATALPFLAVLAGRVSGQTPLWKHTLPAGLLAGLTVAIKPHFALALVLPFGLALLRRRDWRLVATPEALCAALLVGAYAASVPLFFPHYLDMLPGLIDAYVANRLPLTTLALQPWPLLHIVLLATLGFAMIRCRRAPAMSVLTALASLGFLLAAFAQGKGWINHYFGGVALAVMALAFFFAPLVPVAGGRAAHGGDWARLRLVVLFALVPGLAGGVFLFRQIYEDVYPGLAAEVRRAAPAHPSLIALSGELTIGHPLVREIDGVWAGRPGALWLTVTSGVMLKSGTTDPAYRARLTGYIHQDAAMFVEDVRGRRPDVILVEDATYPKLFALAPELAGALDGYVRAGGAAGISVWIRKAGL